MFSKQLKQLRKAKLISQETMAKLMCMTQGQYSRLENGITKLTLDKLEKAATILQVDMKLLLVGEK